MTVNQPLLLLSRAALPDSTAIVSVANNHPAIRARSKKPLPPSHLLFFTIFHWQKEASWQGACKNMFAISQAQQCTSKCRWRGVGREKALSYWQGAGFLATISHSRGHRTRMVTCGGNLVTGKVGRIIGSMPHPSSSLKT